MKFITYFEFIIQGIFHILLNQAVLFDLIAKKINPDIKCDAQIIATAERMSKDTEKMLQRFSKKARSENEQYTTGS